MSKVKLSESKAKLLEMVNALDNDTIIEELLNLYEKDYFIKALREKSNLAPVWILLSASTSSNGNRFVNTIVKAAKSKSTIGLYLFDHPKGDYETRVVFLAADLTSIEFWRYENLGFYNYGGIITNEKERAIVNDSNNSRRIEQLPIDN